MEIEASLGLLHFQEAVWPPSLKSYGFSIHRGCGYLASTSVIDRPALLTNLTVSSFAACTAYKDLFLRRNPQQRDCYYDDIKLCDTTKKRRNYNTSCPSEMCSSFLKPVFFTCPFSAMNEWEE